MTLDQKLTIYRIVCTINESLFSAERLRIIVFGHLNFEENVDGSIYVSVTCSKTPGEEPLFIDEKIKSFDADEIIKKLESILGSIIKVVEDNKKTIEDYKRYVNVLEELQSFNIIEKTV